MEAKQYAAVLTAATRRLTEDDASITTERIKQEVFPDGNLEGLSDLLIVIYFHFNYGICLGRRESFEAIPLFLFNQLIESLFFSRRCQIV